MAEQEAMAQYKGWGPWRQIWLSICSAHGLGPQATCPRCRRGYYRNVWGTRLEGAFFSVAPSTWRWLANRKPRMRAADPARQEP